MGSRKRSKRGRRPGLVAGLVCAISPAACKPPPEGRPLYTPIPESLQPQAVQPASPQQREQVAIEVEVSDGEATVLEAVFATLVDAEASSEHVDEHGRVSLITVHVSHANPKTGAYPLTVTYAVDDEVHIEGARSPLPGQVVAFDGADDLRLELVVHRAQ